jgi:uncharacterized repeat protein (TIGR02059 family)
MKKLIAVALAGINCFLQLSVGLSQSPSFKTFTNPVIPGDHSDCTLTKVGNDFYTTGSSFNPTPVIYHSTDLIHWEAIAQPLSAAWSNYGDKPQGGCWGGHIVYYNNKWWDFFGKDFVMYFETADKPEGPWSSPVLMKVPSSVPGFGADNSIFIDTDSTWYLLVKNGQPNNWIVQLGKDGQASGAVYNLTWLNPSPSYPYSWAEGPVMWNYHGFYYYSFARDVSGGQKIMRSVTLTGDQSAWSVPVDFFNENDPGKPTAIFSGPNHSSAAVMLSDSTSWVMHPVWARANSNEWYGNGRQGLVNQVHYNSSDIPVADYPHNKYFTAPKLPSSGIPWMVPKSDFFTSTTLGPEWSFLGYTPVNLSSLTERPGWLRLRPKSATKANTVIKTDAEHNYSLITRLDFNALATTDEAGIRIMNGDENLYAKIYSSYNSAGHKVISFSYTNIYYETDNNIGNILWLKLVRVNHILTGFYSADGNTWHQVGKEINVSGIDNYTTNYNGWCGNRQGLYVLGSSADFDMYIYRDAYTPILAECPANRFGPIRTSATKGIAVLDSIHNDDWALYAGVEFGNKEYAKTSDSVQIIASSATNGGNIEIWLDSIETGNKIGTCNINSTGNWNTFNTFSAKINQITGRHDVYLRFTGKGTSRLFQLQWVKFISKNALQYISSGTTSDSTVSVKLSKPITGPASSSGFIITLNGAEKDSITQFKVNSSDSSLISFFVKKKFNNSDIIKISFRPENNGEGLNLYTFGDTIVDNLLAGSAPRIVKVQTSLNGDSIIVKFNKKMNSPANYSDEFKITSDLLNNPINSISLENNDSTTFIFKMKNKIYYENINILDYSGIDVKSNDNGIVKNFAALPVTNVSLGYPPLVKFAALRKTSSIYNIIALKFDRPLGDVSTQLGFFNLTVNGQTTTIKSISGSSDSVRLSVFPYLQYGHIVKLSYSGGSIVSLHGGILADFSDYLITNNIPLSIKKENLKLSNAIKVYPNPLSNELNFTTEVEFNRLSIYNIEGILLLEKNYSSNIKEASIPLNFAKGTYILKLRNNSSSDYTKIIVQ